MKIGLALLVDDDAGLGTAPRWEQIRDEAMWAEERGFDSIWIYDHLVFRPGGDSPTIGMWEGWAVLIALGAVTERVELGPLVLCNQFRNPTVLAKQAHTLDEISNGRLIFGIGAGWNRAEFDAFGFPFDHRVDRFEEALQIIGPLLREGEVDFEGTYYRARRCEILPRSPRPGGPPLLVGGSGPRMLRLTARYADQWNGGHFGMPETVDESLAQVRQACEEVGRDPATLELTAAIIYRGEGAEPVNWGHQPLLTGGPDDIAAALAGYRDRGIAHVQFRVYPYRREVCEVVAAGMDLFRQS